MLQYLEHAFSDEYLNSQCPKAMNIKKSLENNNNYIYYPYLLKVLPHLFNGEITREDLEDLSVLALNFKVVADEDDELFIQKVDLKFNK